ncbi:hypothetical protein LPJ64_000642 [Coemansia asiatica]|uniref:Uncharacterized protein n=1 Tax=Coemansia asiatica TaxID=1052880 RepID=A0A9W7XRG7_9FUNG|nr:hypothetical protein LPJ64_000642 [Coemansia asiatica]
MSEHASPVDIETSLAMDSSDMDIENGIEMGTLGQDGNQEEDVLTVKLGFFSYINSVFNDMASDNVLDSSEINELISDWNAELSENIVYESESESEGNDDVLNSFNADEQSDFTDESNNSFA